MANFNNNPAAQFDRLLELQPDKPLMSMEYWAGWFDHWWDKHDTGLSPTRKKIIRVFEQKLAPLIYLNI